ncbi:hypothetical protein ACRWHJ_25335, partial [Escherichia coli]
MKTFIKTLLVAVTILFSVFATAKQVKLPNNIKYVREGANKRGNSSRLTQSFHFFMFEPIFSPVNALN